MDATPNSALVLLAGGKATDVPSRELRGTQESAGGLPNAAETAPDSAVSARRRARLARARDWVRRPQPGAGAAMIRRSCAKTSASSSRSRCPMSRTTQQFASGKASVRSRSLLRPSALEMGTRAPRAAASHAASGCAAKRSSRIRISSLLLRKRSTALEKRARLRRRPARLGRPARRMPPRGPRRFRCRPRSRPRHGRDEGRSRSSLPPFLLILSPSMRKKAGLVVRESPRARDHTIRETDETLALALDR